ncbi:hypothetical protein C0J52_15725 [Blattella germanica]|nr:hypothetical protein C0J52_15725 [Blattella germanica]
MECENREKASGDDGSEPDVILELSSDGTCKETGTSLGEEKLLKGKIEEETSKEKDECENTGKESCDEIKVVDEKLLVNKEIEEATSNEDKEKSDLGVVKENQSVTNSEAKEDEIQNIVEEEEKGSKEVRNDKAEEEKMEKDDEQILDAKETSTDIEKIEAEEAVTHDEVNSVSKDVVEKMDVEEEIEEDKDTDNKVMIENEQKITESSKDKSTEGDNKIESKSPEDAKEEKKPEVESNEEYMELDEEVKDVESKEKDETMDIYEEEEESKIEKDTKNKEKVEPMDVSEHEMNEDNERKQNTDTISKADIEIKKDTDISKGDKEEKKDIGKVEKVEKEVMNDISKGDTEEKKHTDDISKADRGEKDMYDACKGDKEEKEDKDNISMGDMEDKKDTDDIIKADKGEKEDTDISKAEKVEIDKEEKESTDNITTADKEGKDDVDTISKADMEEKEVSVADKKEEDVVNKPEDKKEQDSEVPENEKKDCSTSKPSGESSDVQMEVEDGNKRTEEVREQINFVDVNAPAAQSPLTIDDDDDDDDIICMDDKGKTNNRPKIRNRSSVNESASNKRREIVIDLDDDDDDDDIEIETIRTKKKRSRTGSAKGVSCCNIECSSHDQNLQTAPVFVLTYFGRKYKKGRMEKVCDVCFEEAMVHQERLAYMLVNRKPLLSAKFPPRNDTVILSDSDEDGIDEDDRLPDEVMEYLRENLQDIMETTMKKYDLDYQIAESQKILSRQLDKLSDGFKETDDTFNQLQKRMDQLRNDIYKDYAPKIKELPPLTIDDSQAGVKEPIIRIASSGMTSNSPQKNMFAYRSQQQMTPQKQQQAAMQNRFPNFVKQTTSQTQRPNTLSQFPSQSSDTLRKSPIAGVATKKVTQIQRSVGPNQPEMSQSSATAEEILNDWNSSEETEVSSEIQNFDLTNETRMVVNVTSESNIPQRQEDVVALEQVQVTHKPLPPIGPITRPKPRLGDVMYVMKLSFYGVWSRAKLSSGNLSMYNVYKVKFESSYRKSNPVKQVTGKQMAYTTPSPVRFPVGTRVIAIFQDNDWSKECYYSGVIAEPPKSMNQYRETCHMWNILAARRVKRFVEKILVLLSLLLDQCEKSTTKRPEGLDRGLESPHPVVDKSQQPQGQVEVSILQVTRCRGKRVVMYNSPCGRRLRTLDELHRYLRVTKSNMGIDLFDFDFWVHCFAEFVLERGFSNIKGGKNYGDEYLAELDYIEVVEKLKEGYESDVVEDSDSLGEEKSYASTRRSKEEEEAETSQDARDSDEEFQLSPWEKQRDPDDPDEPPRGGYRTRLRNRSSRHGSDDSQADKDKNSGRSKDKDVERDSDKAVRQPSRFAVVSDPLEDKNKKPKHRSVREFFGSDEYCYIMDAKNNGNIGRYLNHSCSPNVFVQNVFVDTHDLRFPWVAFFALTYIQAGTELTWDYNYDVGSVPGKVLHCYCGSNDCRGRLL